MKEYNLIGKRFGKLLVIEKVRLEGTKRIFWKCLCDCGNECLVMTAYLNNGRKTECGNNIKRPKINDLTGKKFGKLTVIRKEQEKKGKLIKWICECECGNTHEVRGSHLIHGKIRSCGCLRQESKVTYEFLEDYVVGITENGEKFKVDIQDYELIKPYNWFVDKDGYIVATRENKKIILTHLIMNPKEKEVVDHIDRDVRNNRRSNLRNCTLSQNAMNRKRPIHNSSGKKGVSYNKHKDKWVAYIGVKSKQISLGVYDNFEDAVAARIKAEEVYHGEYKRSE